MPQVLAMGPALSYPQVDHAFSDLVDLLVTGEPELALPAAATGCWPATCRPGEPVNPYTLAQTPYTPDGLLLDRTRCPCPPGIFTT